MLSFYGLILLHLLKHLLALLCVFKMLSLDLQRPFLCVLW